MVFIIIWKVARELVSPKNMTVGSKSPSGVKKATFGLSPGLMRMLLYPHRISNFVKSVHPLKRSMVWGMRGETLRFLVVHLCTGRKSWTGWSFPSFFLTKKKLQAEELQAFRV